MAADLAETLLAQQKNKIRAITFEQDSIRVYPNGEMACHVIGYTDNEGHGVAGIERSMESFLQARNGYRYSERAGNGNEMVQFRGQERPAQDGSDVHLTIDSGLQMIVEEELDAAARQYKPNMATAIMMRPQTGEILAMANWPHYDLSHWDKVEDPSYRVNHAIMDQIEPGSTFKIVPASAAITLRLVSMDTMIFCENGALHLTTATRCTTTSRSVTFPLREVLMQVEQYRRGQARHSARRDQRLFELCAALPASASGRASIFTGEISGLVIPPSQWSPISITHSADGAW